MKDSLFSVGIDIGTSTTQLVFSRLYIENTAFAWTVPNVKIIDKKIVYRSEIHCTPLKSAEVIDAHAVRTLIEKEYERANVKPADVDTGAVIITGETARKENAEEVLNMLSGLAGDFVVATAGPDLEGVLAGKGSGAWEHSKTHSCTVMNFDIGGGTTNVAIYKNGDVVDSASFDIGGRLIKIDENEQIYYISEKMKQLSKHLKIPVEIGMQLNKQHLKSITDAMAKVVILIATHEKNDSLYQLLITDHDISFDGKIDAICLSGGVADCLQHTFNSAFQFGDLGVLLGESIESAIKNSELKTLTALETIRATVIGAGSHTTDVSGSTIRFDDEVLPIKNVPVIRLSQIEEKAVSALRVEAIRKRVDWFQCHSTGDVVALSLTGDKTLGFDALHALATDIINGMSVILGNKVPLIVLLDNDLGKALGYCLKGQLLPEQPVICIDSVTVDNGDYIDVGRPVAGGQVVPVIIKTLLFGY